MKAYETTEMRKKWAFRRFAVTIEIEDLEQLRALVSAAVRMPDEHGLELADLLTPQLQQYEDRIAEGYQVE